MGEGKAGHGLLESCIRGSSWVTFV